MVILAISNTTNYVHKYVTMIDITSLPTFTMSDCEFVSLIV